MVVKPPVAFQICTQCGWSEPIGTRWDRRRLVYKTFWRATTCPECGGSLARECPTCEAPIQQPDAQTCHQCGQAYPWADRVKISS